MKEIAISIKAVFEEDEIIHLDVISPVNDRVVEQILRSVIVGYTIKRNPVGKDG